MPIQVSDEDFAVILDALRRATSPYSDDEIGAVLFAERQARKVVERIEAERQ